jgi:hypothetical protein
MAMQDTAEPLQPLKPAAQVYTAEGIDLDTAIFIPGVDYDPETDNEDSRKAEGGGVSGFKGRIGLPDDFELGFTNWEGEGKGYKLNLKKRFYHQGNFSAALNPNIYQLTKPENENGEGYRYLYGWQIPLLLTYRPGKLLAGTLEFHYNKDNFTKQYYDSHNPGLNNEAEFDFEHYGIIWGVKATIWKVVLYGEMGYEHIKAINGPVTDVPISGFGIGIDF